MRLQDIMTAEVETIAADKSVVFANELMWRKQIHHLVVLRDEEIVGILSDRDLGGPEAETLPDDLQVHKVMSAAVVTARPDTTVKDAANLMQGRSINCLPVITDTGKLVGIVTSSDLDRLVKQGTTLPEHEGERSKDP